MAFVSSAADALQMVVSAIGVAYGILGAINLLEGYGSDNPGAKNQGVKQLMAGGGIIFIATTLIPMLKTVFN